MIVSAENSVRFDGPRRARGPPNAFRVSNSAFNSTMEWAAVAWSRMRASASPVPSDELRDVVRVELRSRERDDGEMAGRPRWKLAARVSAGDGAGGPAGVLQPLEGDQRVQVAAGPDAVTYAQHTEPGTALTSAGATSWTVEWRPPAVDATPVTFHAAANAANDDASEFGDFIYTASATTRHARSPR